MNLELHLVQNFAPSNLNRDDTGSPKSCDFGGYRRARISSQAIKRAIRKSNTFSETLGQEGAVRTRRLIAEIAERVAGEVPAPSAVMTAVADVFKAGGLERASRREDEENTSILLYLAAPSIGRLADSVRSHLPELNKKSDDRSRILDAIGEELEESAKCPDVALFGRMIEVADTTPFGKRNLRVDAACQVAHPISTHQVAFDFDYFTAVDDLKPEGVTGAGMIGTVEFNSACFYRYANIDLGQLRKNLDGDTDLAATTVRAFLYASRDAIPTGKQNSFAAQNPPSFAFAVVRPSGFWSLANAFVRPVRPRGDEDVVQLSVDALTRHWSDLSTMYGVPSTRLAVCALKSLNVPEPLDAYRVDTYEALVQRVMSAIEA